MDSFDKFFNNNKSSEDSSDNITDVKIENDGNSISIGGISRITFQSSYVGTPTGSNLTDFYVYEWFIKETGEIFYVGKGRGDRYKEYHEHAFEAERIRTHFDTGVKFVAKNLTEEEALELETQEMTRILNETNDRLTNTIIPWFTKRDNGYSRSPSTPLARVQAVYAKRLDSTISVASGVLTPVLFTPTPGVAVMGYIHPTKKGTPEKYSILLGSLFILSIIITSF